MPALVDIRPHERRPALYAAASTFGLTAAHTLLETARDALFLARLPPSALPWMYLLVAAAGIVVTRLGRGGVERPSRLALAMGVGALACAALYPALRSAQGTGWLYFLYVFSAVLSGYLALRLWLLIGATFTVVEAKRLFGPIGAGGVLGAVFGAALGRALLGFVAPAELVLVAAVVLALTAAGPVWRFAGAADRAAPAPTPTPRAPARLADDARAVIEHPYLVRVFGLVLASTVALTAADLLFKTALSARVSPAELARTLATVQLAQNALALVVQLFVVGWALRVAGVHRAMLLLPLCIGAGGALALAGGGLFAAYFLRGADGALRHSLGKTSTELLFVPLPDALRARSKPFVDLVGQRGGQAVVALVGLALAAAGAVSERSLAALVLAASFAWATIALGLRRHYLDLFRDSLRRGRVDAPEALPALDLSALEALIAALNSPRDAEVLGAMELLVAQGRNRLIPALILYHPSRAIVLEALDLFAREGRTDFVPTLDRLVTHPDAAVRAGAIRARARVAFDPAWTAAHLDDAAPEARGTAMICLAERGPDVDVDRAVADANAEVAIAMARAIGRDTPQRLYPLLLALAARPEPDVKLEVAWAMGRTQSASFVPALTAMLADRIAAAGARSALVELDALSALDDALADPTTARELRVAIPRAIADFPARRAAAVLLGHFAREADGVLHYRLIRALQRVRAADPGVVLDLDVLLRAIELNAARVRALRADRAALDSGVLGTALRQLVVAFLRDKELHAYDRMIRILLLACPGERAEQVQRGLHSADAKARAAARELVENLAPAALWRVVAPIMDGEPVLAKETDTEVLRRLSSRAGALGLLAGRHAQELGLHTSPVVQARPSWVDVVIR